MLFQLLHVVLALQGPAARQLTGQAGHGVSRADSIRIVRDVRSAQASFELFRRSHLPLRAGGGSTCDIRIGRYCYWRGDDDGEDDTPPKEEAAVGRRRDELIRKLDTATSTLTGDAWLAGQHVRYLVEADRTDSALVFAHRCSAGVSWCDALAGYAAHKAGRFALADSIFRKALASMDLPERCRWLDISDLLDDELADRFKKTDCAGREALVRRIFRLGSPLFSVSETDLFTEHLSRVTRARIAEHAPSPDGEAWADDQRALTLRYGWPRWYSRSESRDWSMAPSVMGHDGGMPYDYLPKLHAIEHIGSASDEDWDLDDGHASTGYAPSFARSMHDLPSQVASFRRGDSTLIVAAWDARKDTTLLGRGVDGALAMVGLDSTVAITRAQKVPLTGHLSAIAVLDSGFVSLELLAASDRRAARAHVGLPGRTPGAQGLSDVLLYTPSDSVPSNLEDALPTMLASNVVSGSRTVGAFWEAYGFSGERTPVHYTLSVDQIEVGWMQRAKEKLHLDDPTAGLRIQWDEVVVQHDGRAPRGVRLDLSRLRGGKYHVEVSMSVNGDAAVTTSRDIEVR
ncbi:MAG TPA: hypothetical protein VGM50_14235 [Gemmatimonadaceae bacterium]